MDKQRTDDPEYGEPGSKHPHQGETEEPEGTEKRKSTTTGDTDMDADDAKKAGMRPTGSGGSAPPTTENL